ncbi:hypothetical protein ACH427_20900 [Streptomyces sp. NPDC020379]|uniref:VG15 protein n=1 Tax=Streptomyces sp. NPDC020379 TaxID=3365071 RepID=UPI0037997A6C
MTKVRALALIHRRQQTALLRLMRTEFDAARRRYDAAPAGARTEQAWTATLAHLVHRFGTASASLAAESYEQMRRAAGHRTPFTVLVADPPPLAQIAAARRWAANEARRAADRAEAAERKAGADEATAAAARTAPDLLRKAHDREAAAMQRLAALPGRRTIEKATRMDPAALGWARITEGPCCSFCAVLILRGPVYANRQSAETTVGGDPYHDRCDCTAEPVFKGQRWTPTPEAAEWEALYNSATRGVYGADILRAFRRAFDAEHRQREPADVTAAPMST